jgi:hypothetical protein
MIPNSFKFWSTTNREETLPIYDTSAPKSRRARVSPYPTRHADGYALMPLRTKVSISDQLVQCQTYNLEVPKPVFSAEVLGPLIASPGPSEYQKPDSALVASEHHHGASPALDNPESLVQDPLSPVYDTSAPSSEVLGPLIASPGPSENQKPNSALVASGHYHGASPAPDNLIPAPESPVQDTESLIQDTESLVQDPESLVQDTESLVDSPISQVNFNSNSVVQHTSSQSPILRLNLRNKTRPKRRHSGETGEKTRLVPQDVLLTRIANQEKDRMIEKLKDEVSD